MYILQETINNRVANLGIELGKETNKTSISHLVPDCDYEIGSIMSTIDYLKQLVNQHDLFQKPIVELRIPHCIVGKFLDEIASRMPNDARNAFSKLRIIDAYRVFEYDGWDWKLIFIFKS